MSNLTLKAEDLTLARALVDKFGSTATRAGVVEYCETDLGSYRAYNLVRVYGERVGRGEYDISGLVESISAGVNGEEAPAKPARGGKSAKKSKVADVPAAAAVPAPAMVAATSSYREKMMSRERVEPVATDGRVTSSDLQYEPITIPAVDKNFVPFGCFSDVKQLLSSGVFAPAMIFGDSGYGKTTGVEQACAQLKRKLVITQITEETCEDDLIGGMRLVNGNTVFEYGPVVRAYQEGAVLLLDEMDQGTVKLMCLQNALQAKPLFLKKTGETIYPQAGFMVLATGNTKGIGDDVDGRYVGAKMMNEAFLERFSDTMEQGAPSEKIEARILSKLIDDEVFVGDLCKWAAMSRQARAAGACAREIQTRRLIHVAKNFLVYGDRNKAVAKACARFDKEVRDALVNLYTKVESAREAEKAAHAAASSPAKPAAASTGKKTPF